MDVKATIRKLLNLANNEGAMGKEIDNALAYARRLMLAHNVSEEDLTPHEQAAQEEYAQVAGQTCGRYLSAWESTLSWAIVELVGTVDHYVDSGTFQRRKDGVVDFDENGRPRACRRVVFYGPEGDAGDARNLFEEWSATIAALGRMKHGGAFRGPGRSYCEGFARSLHEKVKRSIRDEDRLIESDCRDLVLVGSREVMRQKRQEASRWLREDLGLKLGKSGWRAGGRHHAGAYGDGREDGSRADFSRERQKRLR